MLEAFYDWVAARSPKYRAQKYQRANAESHAANLEVCLEVKKKQMAELQRTISNLQGARDSVQRHNDQLRLMLDNAYKSIEKLTGEVAEAEASYLQYLDKAQRYRKDIIKRVVEGCISKKTPGELIDQGAAMIKESVEKGEPVVMLHEGRVGYVWSELAYNPAFPATEDQP
jgi:chromosome segregation ATPase